jgi:hypothetical protein
VARVLAENISEEITVCLEKWANDMDIIGVFWRMDQGKKGRAPTGGVEVEERGFFVTGWGVTR